MWIGLLLSVVCPLWAAAIEDAGAGPAPASAVTNWEFEFDFLDPQRIEYWEAGMPRPEVYWYIVYTVRNPSRRAERFFPIFQIVTREMQVVDTDVAVNLKVFDAIRAQRRTMHEDLTPPTKAIGALLSGDDNARESVAIWRDVDLGTTDFSVFVAGLSGETQTISNPAYRPGESEAIRVMGRSGEERSVAVNPRVFTLRKTLEIRYALPGSASGRARGIPQRHDVRWVMR